MKNKSFSASIILLLMLTVVDSIEEMAAGEAPVRFFAHDLDRIVRTLVPEEPAPGTGMRL